MPSSKRTVASTGRSAPPKQKSAQPPPGTAREAVRLEAKAARTREYMSDARRREAALEKQGYWF